MFIGLYYCCLLVMVQPLSLAWADLHYTNNLWDLFQGPIIEFRLGYPIFYLRTSKFSPQHKAQTPIYKLKSFQVFSLTLKPHHLISSSHSSNKSTKSKPINIITRISHKKLVNRMNIISKILIKRISSKSIKTHKKYQEFIPQIKYMKMHRGS